MIQADLITKKYAEALVNIEASEQLLDELRSVNQILRDNPDLQTSLENPSIDESSKTNIINSVFKESVSEKVLNLLKLCVKKRRAGIIIDLADNYELAYLESQNIEVASIETPHEMTNAEIESIKRNLEKIFNKGIKVETKLKPELLAGVKINVNNKILDYSLNSKIKNLKQNLKS